MSSSEKTQPTDSPQDRDLIGNCIYAIRWVLAPMYLLLWIAVGGYCIHYALEIVHFVSEPALLFGKIPFYGLALEHHSNEWLLFILELIDITMIGNLVVMTTIGGYSTFVNEFFPVSNSTKPRWMNGIDSSSLKIKMSMSLAGVSAIHLLKNFINLDSANTDWLKITLLIVVHLVFLISTLAFTWNARLMRGLHGHTDGEIPEPKVDPHH